KCTAMWPGLDTSRITGVAVGLRPARSAVRLELESGERPLIHNYGHGGGGVTLSWGCADEVVALLSAAT
ncbi:MAG TPA: FAD-binding oxidoreductase, partial [Candidatus Poseidoniales archaeon]|nr:FAD-binding oxidoreductase [Candidatus Poseidoniales archaeon]